MVQHADIDHTGLTGVGGSAEFDYVQITSPASVTSPASSDATATAVITGSAVAYDGSTRVKIEYVCPFLEAPAALNASLVVNLYDGSTDLGRLGLVTTPAAQQFRAPGKGERFLTPSAATHTYSIRAWVTSGTGTFGAGAGGTGGAYLPAFIRITRA